MGNDLRTYWKDLEEERPEDVLRVSDPVRPDFLPTAVATLVEELPASPAVFFENVEGFDHPVIFNLFGTRERMARAAGATAGTFAERWLNAEAAPIAPVPVASGPVQEVIHVG